MSRPLVLIPSSKAKAEGGNGPAYEAAPSLKDGPLADARREVLHALRAAAEELDDDGITKLCGVKADAVAQQREVLADLASAPTMAAHQRYTGVVHRFAELDTVDPGRAGVDVAIFGGLLGSALLDEAVPDYRLEVTGRMPALGVLGTWWRHRLGEPLRDLAAGRLVWDLLPGEFARLWPEAERDGVDVVGVRFERADGRAAPSASAKVAKGQLLRRLLAAPTLGPDDLVGTDALDGWRLELRDGGLAAVVHA